MWIAIATLFGGIAVGYMGQRSRLCFVGGLRDWLLIRDTDLLKGVLAFFLAAWIAFPVASLLGGAVWTTESNPELQQVAAVWSAAPTVPIDAPSATVNAAIPDLARFRPWLLPAIAVGAGVGLGFASVLANGCPLRQHVLSAQGSRDGWFYLAGFYGIALFYLVGWVPWL